jgi:hypothetical protein
MGARGVSWLDRGLIGSVRARKADRLRKKRTWLGLTHERMGFMTDALARSHASVCGNRSRAEHSLAGAGSGRGSIGGRLVGLDDGPMGPSP